MKYGYARVSTDDQKADCQHIFIDTATGASSQRPTVGVSSRFLTFIQNNVVKRELTPISSIM